MPSFAPVAGRDVPAQPPPTGVRPCCDGSRSPRPTCSACVARGLTICRALPPEELVEMEQLSTVIRIEAGATLFDQGDEAGSVYNLTAGTIRLSKTLADGRRQITGFVLPGDFIGLSSRATHPYSAEAIGPCQLCRFNSATLGRMADRLPRLEHELFDRARDELDAAHDQMLLLGRKSPREKVASFLLELAHRCERWGQRPDRVSLDMTRTDIADYLGLTIETVSRTLTRMKRDGMIALPSSNEIVFLRLDAVRTLAEGS